jgi:hypothetical protein
MKKLIYSFLFFGFLFSCGKKQEEKIEPYDKLEISGLSESELQDKILGMLVGSAIGDAMGAPTEMWSRENIKEAYGFVTRLDTMIRETSPEGIWIADLPSGGTTDDTRWKVLTGRYLMTQQNQSLSATDFASQILSRYQGYTDEFNAITDTLPESFEEVNLKLGWLQEWAKVSEPFIANNLVDYSDALGKFYGGEMVCAGLLYAPALGIYFPGDPEKAYREAYALSIYDLGYAKDLTSLAAGMTAAGMKKGATKDSLLSSLQVDPENYFESRLVGRTANSILTNALNISSESHQLDSLSVGLDPESPALQAAFSALDQRLQDMPFHAGEIWLQSLSAMIYADFDFMGSLVFLVNYGRDNDTTAAVVGGILGAYYGFEQLPQLEREQVLKVNKELLGIDLAQIAKELTSHMLKK